MSWARALLTASVVICSAGALAAEQIAAEDVAAAISEQRLEGFLLDVRTPKEFAEGHVPGARNIPLHELSSRLHLLPRDQPITVYCEVGGRAGKAIGLLEGSGFTQVRELTGSMRVWRAKGLAVE